jgi:MFS family permease
MKDKKTPDFQVGGPKATYVMVICSLLFMVNYMDRQIMAAVLQPMKIDLGLTDFQAGLANTMFYLGVLIFVVPVAHWIDKWSRKKMIGLMAFCWSAFTMFTGFSGSFIQLLSARLGVGLGESGFGAGGTALIAASYPPEKRAAKIGIFNTFITVGILVGMVAGGYVSVHFGGWRTAFYAFAIPGIILGILAFFMQDYKIKKDAKASATPSFLQNMKSLFANRSLRLIYVGYGFFAVVVFSYLTWLPALLMRAYGIDEAKAGLVAGALSILTLIGPILGGLFADKWQSKSTGGRMRLAAVGILTASAALWFAFLTVHDIGNKSMMIFSFVMLCVYGIASGMPNPAVMASTQDVVRPEQKGLASGAAYFCMMLFGGAFGPAMVGKLSDLFGGGYKGIVYGLYVASLFGVAAAIIWWRAAKRVGADMEQERSAALKGNNIG